MNTQFKEWTVDIIRRRVIEAAETVQALPPAQRPKEYGNAMPDIVRAPSDAYGYGKTRYRRVPAPGEISRMEQVWGWINGLERESDRKFIYDYGHAMGRKGRSVTRYCEINGLHKRTFERLIRKIFQTLADHLNKNTLILSSISQVPVSQSPTIYETNQISGKSYGTSWMAPDAKPTHNPAIKQIPK